VPPVADGEGVGKSPGRDRHVVRFSGCVMTATRTPIMHRSWMNLIALALGAAACGTTSPAVPATTSATLPPAQGQPPSSSEAPVAPPGVRAKLVGEQGGTRTYQLVLAPGTEAMKAISDFVVANHIQAAHFHGLGACTDAVLAYYDPTRHAYEKTAYKQQMEIVSIIGDAAPTPGDGAGLHIHMGVAFADGTMHGGHLFETHVSPTMELELTASPIAVHRAYDETFEAWLLVP
jgi:predicted DNA-binding protein with PD1-like motif